MNLEMEHVLPQDIERRSMEIIAQELGDRRLDDANADVIKRQILTTRIPFVFLHRR